MGARRSKNLAAGLALAVAMWRMVQAQLLAKIAAAVGDGVVTALKITGPVAPSWRKGKLHISGRGPRDTYG